MNATIQQLAIAPNPRTYGGDAGRATKIVIDGVPWSSPMPQNAGEAETFNRDAEIIVAKINGCR
jgi:hypothetical protein